MGLFVKLAFPAMGYKTHNTMITKQLLRTESHLHARHGVRHRTQLKSKPPNSPVSGCAPA